MSPVFFLIAALTALSAVAAMSLRNLVHCALCAALTFGGLAGVFLQLGAQFVGLAQILVYVGAVAILIVFAILLTRGAESTGERAYSRSWPAGLAVAALVWISLSAAILGSTSRTVPAASTDVAAAVTARKIGESLMNEYVLPLEIVALLLTAATIGAVIIALQERPRPS
jgi:NADH-quinone oxidoreductase subunit J